MRKPGTIQGQRTIVWKTDNDLAKLVIIIQCQSVGDKNQIQH